MRFFIIIIVIFPLFVNSQNSTPPKIKPNFDSQRYAPKVPEALPTLKPLYLSQLQKAKSKLSREEEKLIKQATKTRLKEADLKTTHEKLQNLEKTVKDSKDSNVKKKIEKCKSRIIKYQNALDKEKITLKLMTKKVEALELAIEQGEYIK